MSNMVGRVCLGVWWWSDIMAGSGYFDGYCIYMGGGGG